MTTSVRESAAAEAARIIAATGDRGSQYGPAEEDYQRACDFFALLTGKRLTVAEGETFMVAVKLSRMAYALQGKAPWKRDTAVDTCGYVALLCELLERSGGQEAP